MNKRLLSGFFILCFFVSLSSGHPSLDVKGPVFSGGLFELAFEFEDPVPAEFSVRVSGNDSYMCLLSLEGQSCFAGYGLCELVYASNASGTIYWDVPEKWSAGEYVVELESSSGIVVESFSLREEKTEKEVLSEEGPGVVALGVAKSVIAFSAISLILTGLLLKQGRL